MEAICLLVIFLQGWGFIKLAKSLQRNLEGICDSIKYNIYILNKHQRGVKLAMTVCPFINLKLPCWNLEDFLLLHTVNKSERAGSEICHICLIYLPFKLCSDYCYLSKYWNKIQFFKHFLLINILATNTYMLYNCLQL